MFITLIVVMVSCVCDHALINRIVHIKYVQLFVYQLYLNKDLINKSDWKVSRK